MAILNRHILNYKNNAIYFDFQILVGKSMEIYGIYGKML